MLQGSCAPEACLPKKLFVDRSRISFRVHPCAKNKCHVGYRPSSPFDTPTVQDEYSPDPTVPIGMLLRLSSFGSLRKGLAGSPNAHAHALVGPLFVVVMQIGAEAYLHSLQPSSHFSCLPRRFMVHPSCVPDGRLDKLLAAKNSPLEKTGLLPLSPPTPPSFQTLHCEHRACYCTSPLTAPAHHTDLSERLAQRACCATIPRIIMPAIKSA